MSDWEVIVAWLVILLNLCAWAAFFRALRLGLSLLAEIDAKLARLLQAIEKK